MANELQTLNIELELEKLKKILLPEYYFERGYHRLLHFKPRDDDIWVVSFPKTGTTWTIEMAAILAHDLDLEKVAVPMDERSPTVERSWFAASSVPDHIARELGDVLEYIERLESPRVIKTHMPWEALPVELRRPDCKAKIIYVARNPKDTCTSLYKYCIQLGTPKDFFRANQMLTGTTMYGPFWDHVLPFWEHRHQQNILFITYEDMIKDLPAVLQKTAAFLGKKPLTPEQVEKAVNHLSFENMKKNPNANREKYMKFFNQKDKNAHFFQSGKIGSWKEEMTPDMVKMFDEWTKKNTEGTGLTF